MALALLGPHTPFPPPELALDDPPGLLAVGGDLTPRRLHAAYSQGIFPWFSPGQPILWWSPDPRMVLHTAEFAPSRSLRKTLARIERGQAPIQVRMDTDCRAVIAGCAAPRPQQPGTWIVPAMQHAYLEWHRTGHVHSIETYLNGRLAGGLYGVSIGRMFFGESMFARATDASKIALACAVRWLAAHGVSLIDCQQETAHLVSLGARTMPRAEFLAHLRQAAAEPAPPWAPGELRPDGSWHALVSWNAP